MRYVYLFHEGNAQMKSLLGGKGANLAEMTNLGLPVPYGMTISTDACRDYYAHGGKLPEGLVDEVTTALARVEEKVGKKFGDEHDPLLLSVRSGAVFSMPGMMDTILNLGLNRDTFQALARLTNNTWFACDTYRRFIQMFSDVVMEVPKEKFEHILSEQKAAQGVSLDQELSVESLETVIERYKELYRQEVGSEFPEDVHRQLLLAIEAVFRSWNNHRAIVYRTINKIDHNLGTAVNIQSMVFGNMGDNSGSGVAFTRNPSTGEKKLYGEYLFNAQGEDVVAGVRTPKPIARLADEMPDIYNQFSKIAETLETHYRDMQDIELTIERGRLFILQTRNGKRTAQAALKIACDMVEEGLIDKKEAVLRIDPEHLANVLHRQIDSSANPTVLATGLAASPGAAFGSVVFDANEAEHLGRMGAKVILVRVETTPDDIHGIVQAQGILTSRGGMTSHAAVVTRGMGKPCVCGCEAVVVDYDAQTFTVGDTVIKKGDLISIDGTTGRVILGAVPLKDPELSHEYQTILGWADEFRDLQVRANADTPEDAEKSRRFGAEGIGLTRTEHMFMAQERLPYVQKMILAETTEERTAALLPLQIMQENDFYGILKAMNGLPVCIRLLDPPLHEFLPSLDKLLVETTELRVRGDNPDLLAEKERLLAQVEKLHEVNPMLGHRGCRLGITYPEVYEMQMYAIFNAASRLARDGYTPLPEIEIPLTISLAEMAMLKERCDRIARECMELHKVEFPYLCGSMIELPRAALLAGEIAEAAEFFSFGTNDLTQTCFGFSRDDAEGKFLPVYINQHILKDNPFAVLDRKGVGRLMEIAIDEGRKTRPGLMIGICGEHGGDPSSVEFCHQAGLDLVSCSPYRIPIARLAAAQAALKYPRTRE
ncbi:pyruvate, phosphate dikinase [uncultured Mailhella sp.]|uniref:pyruvate, phosphate dikinase n=1 Tax=uncultured Mailhella sp. TaxID=1981031 RepID=UPI0025DA13BB|nr:pyruvate, phosphate dikinase [uncultured Mailhella sp.]